MDSSWKAWTAWLDDPLRLEPPASIDGYPSHSSSAHECTRVAGGIEKVSETMKWFFNGLCKQEERGEVRETGQVGSHVLPHQGPIR